MLNPVTEMIFYMKLFLSYLQQSCNRALKFVNYSGITIMYVTIFVYIFFKRLGLLTQYKLENNAIILD